MKKLLGLTILALFVSCGKQSDINKLQDRIDDNKDSIDRLEDKLNKYYNDLEVMSGHIDSITKSQSNLQDSITDQMERIVELETDHRVIEIIDPCGDNPNQFDEVILKLSDGTFIAYFEQNGKRFLSMLPNGNYRTTDRQACNFTINNGELID